MNQFEIRIRLADCVREDSSKLSRFPDIDDSEHDRIGWSVSRRFGMFDGNQAITVSEFSDSDFIDDYIWRLLHSLHSTLPEILAGEDVDKPILDNPGCIKFRPLDDDTTRVIFDSERGDEEIVRETTVRRMDIARAVISASNDLVEQLLDLNSDLGNSRLVTEL